MSVIVTISKHKDVKTTKITKFGLIMNIVIPTIILYKFVVYICI